MYTFFLKRGFSSINRFQHRQLSVPDQSRLLDRVQHMRESGPLSKVGLLQINLFKITLDMNDCPIRAGCLPDLLMQDFICCSERGG